MTQDLTIPYRVSRSRYAWSPELPPMKFDDGVHPQHAADPFRMADHRPRDSRRVRQPSPPAPGRASSVLVAVAHDADEDGGGRGHYILRPSIGDVLLHMLHRHLETRPVPGIDLPPGPLRSRWPAVRPGLRYRLRFSGWPFHPGTVRILAFELGHRLLAFGSPGLVLLPVVVDRPAAVGAIHVASRRLTDAQVSSLRDLEASGEDPRLPVRVCLLPVQAEGIHGLEGG